MADKVKPTDIDIENMTTPTKEQIEKVAFELFNADFCAMTEADWDWRPERIKSQYRAMAQIAIIEWEKIRNSPKQGKIWEEQYASKN